MTRITSYINNLHPQKHTELVSSSFHLIVHSLRRQALETSLQTDEYRVWLLASEKYPFIIEIFSINKYQHKDSTHSSKPSSLKPFRFGTELSQPWTKIYIVPISVSNTSSNSIPILITCQKKINLNSKTENPSTTFGSVVGGGRKTHEKLSYLNRRNSHRHLDLTMKKSSILGKTSVTEAFKS